MKPYSGKHKQSSAGRRRGARYSVMPAKAVIRVQLNPAWFFAPSADRQGLEFDAQAERWRRETLHVSSLTKMVMHPSYLRIIGMGRSVLPRLFAELQVRPDHWLVALNAITGVDPVPPGSSFDEAVNAWLDWGKSQGYIA